MADRPLFVSPEKRSTVSSGGPKIRRFPIICGPTASGKSHVATILAKSYPIEVISADSRQVIKHLNIGTAKPTAQEQAELPVHLIDLIEPGERYSAARFIDDCDRAIDEILARQNIPVIVGGTGLYQRALTDGFIQIEGDVTEIRQKLAAEAEAVGAERMHQKLTAIDPEEAARIHPNNLRHLLRALEIFFQTGQIKSELVRSGAYKRSKYQFEQFCLIPPREELYDKINRRVELMLEAGWLDEIKLLTTRSCDDTASDPVCSLETLRSAAVIGYTELIDYLGELISYEEAIRLIKQNSRRFAKRQMTWYRNSESIAFFDNRAACETEIDQFLEAYLL